MTKPAALAGPSGQPLAKGRRTQAERREETRRRLIEATLRCLARDGYAGTTIQRIVSEAGLSHGASGHHFPTKAALLQEAAEELVRDAYRRFGRALLGVGHAQDRLAALLGATWREVFDPEKIDAFLEILVASKRDPELLERLKPFARAGMEAFRRSADHFFAPKRDDIDVHSMMLLTQWLFRGMSMDQRFATSPREFEPFLELWIRLMSELVEARPAVTDPPPKPEWPGVP